MPHNIFHLQEKFFDEESNCVGRLGAMDIKLKAMKALSFDKGLLRRLLSARPEVAADLQPELAAQ